MLLEEKKDATVEKDETNLPAEPNRCYTVQDLATILGVGKKSIYSLLKKNEFRSIQLASGIYGFEYFLISPFITALIIIIEHPESNRGCGEKASHPLQYR